jgi:signal transduction histidine kinase
MKMDTPYGVPQVLRTGSSELVPFASDDLLVATKVDDEHLKILRALGFTSSMTVPLLIEGKAEGTLTFALAESSRHYTQADLIMAQELASRASLAIQNARLYQAVQQSRDQLDIILQGVADGILVYAPDNRILYANEAAVRTSSYGSVQQMLAEQHSTLFGRYELIDEQGQPFPYTQLPHLRVFAGEPEAQAVIGSQAVGSEQPERWSLVTSRPVMGESREVAMVVTIVHDITERLLTERRKDAFISMASHELKTPVTSLKGFTNILQRRLTRQGDAQGLHYLARIDAQLDRLTTLISELLDISRMQSGKLALREEPFALDVLIKETVEEVQAASSTHHLLIEESTGVQVVGDQERLRQVFINLLNNAIKYSPTADRVVVRLLRDDEDGQALVSVQDFGIGIDQAHHEQIFERFYQVSDPEGKTYPGLGIGLHISREIVERHQGRLWVESSKGNGATFFVALPVLSLSEQADLG